MKSKICKRCDVEKPLIMYSRVTRNKDGLERYCKDCCKAIKRELLAERLINNYKCAVCCEPITDLNICFNTSKCRDCYNDEQRRTSKDKTLLIMERGDMTLHKRRVLYFVNKIKLNDYFVSMEDINELITLFQLTFLSIGSPFGFKYMFDRLVKRSLTYNLPEKKKIKIEI